jgi:hypothetical protein
MAQRSGPLRRMSFVRREPLEPELPHSARAPARSVSNFRNAQVPMSSFPGRKRDNLPGSFVIPPFPACTAREGGLDRTRTSAMKSVESAFRSSVFAIGLRRTQKKLRCWFPIVPRQDRIVRDPDFARVSSMSPDRSSKLLFSSSPPQPRLRWGENPSKERAVQWTGSDRCLKYLYFARCLFCRWLHSNVARLSAVKGATLNRQFECVGVICVSSERFHLPLRRL